MFQTDDAQSVLGPLLAAIRLEPLETSQYGDEEDLSDVELGQEAISLLGEVAPGEGGELGEEGGLPGGALYDVPFNVNLLSAAQRRPVQICA